MSRTEHRPGPTGSADPAAVTLPSLQNRDTPYATIQQSPTAPGATPVPCWVTLSVMGSLQISTEPPATGVLESVMGQVIDATRLPDTPGLTIAAHHVGLITWPTPPLNAADADALLERIRPWAVMLLCALIDDSPTGGSRLICRWSRNSLGAAYMITEGITGQEGGALGAVDRVMDADDWMRSAPDATRARAEHWHDCPESQLNVTERETLADDLTRFLPAWVRDEGGDAAGLTGVTPLGMGAWLRAWRYSVHGAAIPADVWVQDRLETERALRERLPADASDGDRAAAAEWLAAQAAPVPLAGVDQLVHDVHDDQIDALSEQIGATGDRIAALVEELQRLRRTRRADLLRYLTARPWTGPAELGRIARMTTPGATDFLTKYAPESDREDDDE